MELGDSFAHDFRSGSEGHQGMSTTVDQSLSTLGSSGISLIGGVDDNFFTGFCLGKGGHGGVSDMGTSDELVTVSGESAVMTSNDSLLIVSDVEGDFCLCLESAGGTGKVSTSLVNVDIVESSILRIGDINNSFANVSVGL